MELELVPVRTRILTHKDDIVDAIREYAEDITDRDIICTAESVLAITQGRYVRPEELSPCWQARLMNRFVPAASAASPAPPAHKNPVSSEPSAPPTRTFRTDWSIYKKK